MSLMMDQLLRGTGIFSPLALPSHQKLARTLAPSIASMFGSQQSASADIIGNLIRERLGKTTTAMTERGNTERQKSVNEASLQRQELMNIGNQLVQKLANEGLLSRESMVQTGLDDRLRRGLKFQEDMLDNLAIMKHRASKNRTATPGGVGMSVVDEIDNGAVAAPGMTVPEDIFDIFNEHVDH